MLRRRIDPHSNFSLFIFNFSFASSVEAEELKCDPGAMFPAHKPRPRITGEAVAQGWLRKESLGSNARHARRVSGVFYGRGKDRIKIRTRIRIKNVVKSKIRIKIGSAY